jgi:hypothetical protein
MSRDKDFHYLKYIDNLKNQCFDTQVNGYGYPYFHRKFASYGAVNGPCFLVILGALIRHRIFTVYARIRAVISLW